MKTFLQRIFLTPEKDRLRAGWRFALFVGLMIVLGIPIGLLGSQLMRLTGLDGMLGAQVVNLIYFLVGIGIARRWIDRRSFASLGVTWGPHAWRDLLIGIAIALPMMGLIFAIEQMAGWLKVLRFVWQMPNSAAIWREAAVTFLLFVLVGWNEELVSRGYILQNLEDGLNTFWALVISAGLFGAAHLGNPNATWVSAAGIFLAGLFLGYAYLRTRSLWLPIGLHIGWNFFEGVVFGFPVSGLNIPHLVQIHVSGPVLWTGGAFGPEAGLVVIPALALGTWLVYLYTKGRLAS